MFTIMNPFRAGQEFRKLKSERKWALALIIVFAAGLLSAAGKGILLQKEQDVKTQYLEEMGLPTEDFEVRIAFLIIFVPASWLLKSVAFHVLARILGGEKVNLSSTVHMIAFTHLPCILKGSLDVLIGVLYQPPSYETFVYNLENPDILLLFVREYNIFFWAFTLMVIAVREQYNLSTKKAVLVVLILYAAVWIIQIAMISSGSLFRVGI